MGSIYKVTNAINGKVYIGQTVQKPETRWRQHINSSIRETYNDHNVYFHIAIRKYGQDAFLFEEIEKCDNSELDDREIFWIDYYQSFNNKYGYNLTFGGQGSLKYTDEEILKMWNEKKSVGKIHDEIGINRGWASARLKACGITDDEIKYRRYESAKETRGTIVYQYTLAGDYVTSFKSVNDAMRITSIGHIEKCCIGEQQQAGGFQWSYKKLNKMPPYKHVKSTNVPREVLQIAVDTQKVIAEYESIAEASRVTGADTSGIAKVCKDKQRTAGGYIWIYKSDYEAKIAA